MHVQYPELYFTTASIFGWKSLLFDDDMKDIIINSFRFLVREKRCAIYAFVIMPNHIHIVWSIEEPYTLSQVQAALTSFTAHAFQKKLRAETPNILEMFRVDKSDREYQFWQRDPKSIAIVNEQMFYRAVNYIHRNPVAKRWILAPTPEMYKYSSGYNNTHPGYWEFLSEFWG